MSMNITLQLNPDVERRLREAAVRKGQTVELYLEELIEQLLPASQASAMSTEEWIAAWRAWAESHPPLPYIADDSRESIYAGRGE